MYEYGVALPKLLQPVALMAPVRESSYFPPLDKCLDGRHQLLSWKTTYIGLTQLENISPDGSLERHLTDAYTVELLKKCFLPYPQPGPQTKSSFETKTSAINVTPSAQGRCDIKQIQDDALWLSNEANIDEVSALRITILEWQNRPAAQLLQWSSVETKSGAGSSIYGLRSQAGLAQSRSTLFSNSTTPSTPNAAAPASEVGRRLRLFETYLSERHFVIKVCRHVVFTALYETRDGEIAGSQKSNELLPNWISEVGQEILTSWDIQGVFDVTGHNIFVSSTDALRSRLDALQQGSQWFKDQEAQEFVEAAWGDSQTLELLSIMELMVVLLTSCKKLPRSDALVAWFMLMEDHRFFDSFEPPFQELYNTRNFQLQSLTSLVSLGLLQLPLATDLLASMSAAATSIEEHAPGAAYLLNSSAISKINSVLTSAAEALLEAASPAILAWSIILQTLREYTFLSRDERPKRKPLRESDRFARADSSESESAEQLSFRSSGSSLRRLSSTGSDLSQAQTYLEAVLDTVTTNAAEGDPIALLARSAVDGSKVLNVVAILAVDFCAPFGSDHNARLGLEIRKLLLSLIRGILGFLDYQPDLLTAILAILTRPQSYWELLDQPVEFSQDSPVAAFLDDNLIVQRIFEEARSRFPYETLPYLRICRALATYNITNKQEELRLPASWPRLSATDVLTCVMPNEFTGSRLIEEDEDISLVQLTDTLEFIDRNQTLSPGSFKRLKTFLGSGFNQPQKLRHLPSGTIGRVLSETKPLVVMWQHDYSPLAYFGTLLRSAASNEMTNFNGQPNLIQPDTIAEIIDMISVTLMTAIKGASTAGAAYSAAEVTENLLGMVNEGLDYGQDLVSVVFDIFEQELSRQRKGSQEDASLEISIACVQFTHAIMQVMPDRVWPFLGRSSLLGIKEGESQLSAIVASTEMAMARYDFLLGCIHLFESLIDDAISHAVLRKTPSKAVARFAASQALGTGVSQLIMGKVLSSFQRIMVDVFESTPTWTFSQPVQKLEINALLSSIFSNLIKYCFQVDDQSKSTQKLAAPLLPAAELIIDLLLSKSTSDAILIPLLTALQDGTSELRTEESRYTNHWRHQTVSTIKLAVILLEVNSFLGQPRSRLEEHLLKNVSVIIKVYAAHPAFRAPAVQLLDSLVQCANVSDNQPTSLLGQIGEESAADFLEVLAVIDQPLRNNDLSISIWNLMSSVVSKRQQWFAIYALTGETPRETIKRKKSELANNKQTYAIFNVALDNLSSIGRLYPGIASAMLEFVALAADYWPWVMTIIEHHSHFLNAMLEYVAQVETFANTTQNRSSQAGMEYYKIQMTSHAVEILAMFAQYARQTGKTSFAKDLLPNLAYVTTVAVSPPNYNASLHSNLRKNFEHRFDTCKITNFKRTTLSHSSPGNSFFYDLEIAEKMLDFDSAWSGKDNQGFARELARVNINLSVVDAQVNLLNSFKFLAIELSKSLSTDLGFQKTMAEIIMDCLRTNAQINLPEAIFEQLAQSRAELAFTLLQRLVDVKSSRAEARSILFIAWDAMRALGIDLSVSLSSGSVVYCRTLLRILCLSVQVIAFAPSPASSETINNTDQLGSPPKRLNVSNFTLQTVLEVLQLMVAQGFHSLTTLLHEPSTSILPSDFALLSAILRFSLQISGLDRFTTALVSAFADAQTSRSASTLLSWSDQLATDRDPIYGELSINFLLEMSSVPALAETLAVEGIISSISNTNLIKYLRQGSGMGPFDQPARMYNIWVRGILPLFLNLLHAVGASMAAEVAAALTQFEGQISRASQSFTYYSEPPISEANGGKTAGYITLTMVSEAQTLAVMTRVLETYREAGASAGVVPSEIPEIGYDAVRVREDVETWLQKRGVLRERIVPVGEREEGWARMKAERQGNGFGSRLEEKLVEEMAVVLALLRSREEQMLV